MFFEKCLHWFKYHLQYFHSSLLFRLLTRWFILICVKSVYFILVKYCFALGCEYAHEYVLVEFIIYELIKTFQHFLHTNIILCVRCITETIFFLERVVSSRVLKICMRKRWANLLENISFIFSFSVFKTTFLSFASKRVKQAHATWSPYCDANNAGSVSFSKSLTFFILSISLEFLYKIWLY
jgi:hypothetical protein